MHKVIHENICMLVLSIVEENPINDKRLHVENETYKPSNEELNSFSLYLLTFEVIWNDFPVPNTKYAPFVSHAKG